ncbi:MAG: GlcG/HbpS family heme-binding protein [Myxococcales bacterium]
MFQKPFGNALLPFALAVATAAGAQQSPAPAAKPAATSTYAIPIGASIGLDTARKVAAAASSEARKNGWFMAIAVVDPAGTLVYYEKADTTQLGSADVAIDKARSAALYKRPTKAFEDALAKGGLGLRILGLKGAVPVDGGVPLLVEGKLVGAIGVSGDLAEHDAQCAGAGAAAVAAANPPR